MRAAFQRHYAGAVDFDSIPRAIGNNVGPAGRAALARIAWTLASLPRRQTGIGYGHEARP